MSANTISQPERWLTHIYVRDAQNAFVRPCWRSGNDLYCGMCMRATIRPLIGEVCAICSSTVERILEVTPGGAPKAARRHGECLIRVGAQKSRQTASGVLVEFFDSRKAGT